MTDSELKIWLRKKLKESYSPLHEKIKDLGERLGLVEEVVEGREMSYDQVIDRLNSIENERQQWKGELSRLRARIHKLEQKE